MDVSYRDNSPQTHWKLSITLFDLTRKFSTSPAHFAVSSKRVTKPKFEAESLGIRPVSERQCCDITTHTDRGAAVWRVFKASCGHEKTQQHSVSNQGLIWGGFFFMIWVLSVFWQRYISEP